MTMSKEEIEQEMRQARFSRGNPPIPRYVDKPSFLQSYEAFQQALREEEEGNGDT